MSSISVLRKLGAPCVALLFCACAVYGQVQGGIPRYASTSGGPDIVNLSNLNMQISIPIINRTGRMIDLTYAMNYNSGIYGPVTYPTLGDTTVWTPSSTLLGWSEAGSNGPSVYVEAVTQGTAACIQEHTGSYYSWATESGILFSDYKGVLHPFPVTLTGPGSFEGQPGGIPPGLCGASVPVTGTPSANTFSSVAASDGSGITMAGVLVPPGNGSPSTTTIDLVVTMPNGVQLTFTWNIPGSGEETYASLATEGDNNGNYMNSSGAISPGLSGWTFTAGYNGGTSVTDTLGNSDFEAYDPQTDQKNNPIQLSLVDYTYGDGSGAQVSVTPNYTSYTIQTNFGCSGISEYSGTVEGNYIVPSPLMSSLTLADGRSYGFTYEPGATAGTVTGRIASITLPSGGSITYSYLKNPTTGASINCNTGSPLGFTRTVNDGKGNSYTWNYQNANNITTVTDPTKAYSVHTFVPINGDLGAGFLGQEYAETSTVSYDSSSNVLSTVNRTYNAGVSGAQPTYPIVSILTTSFLPDKTGVANGINQVFSPLGMPTETDVYDYGLVGSGAAGSLLSKTSTTYWTSLGLVYDRPHTVTTYGPNGTTITAETMYTFDQTSVKATSGVPNHNTGYNVGNLTTMSRLVSGSNWLNWTYVNYDTGNVYTATDPNGAVTTYSYAQCGNSLLSGVSTTTNAAIPVTLTSSQTWNCGTSTIYSSTDVNGNTSLVSHNDPYDRPTGVEDPFGNVTSITYPTTSSNSSTSVMNFNSDASTNSSITTYDGLARPILQQNRQGVSSASYDSVATTYDSIGLPNYTSVAYTAAVGNYVVSGPGVQTIYDPLGRTAQVTDGGGGYTQYVYKYNDVTVTTGPKPTNEALKVRVLESDGSGALKSVCEVTSTLPSTGPCLQTIGTVGDTGYLTKYTRVPGTFTVQQDAQTGGIGSQTRAVNVDLLGRTISETIPELGSNGVAGMMTYHYDSDPSGNCSGSFPGDLVYQKDAAGNITCFTYDNQHRMLSTTVVSGPQSAATAQSHFVYDVATVNGTVMQNAKGALVEAYTCANPGTCTTKLTDVAESAYPEGSPGSYTGRIVQQVLESTPNSVGYFTAQATTFPNGARGNLTVSKGTTAILPTLAFGLDGEGRPYSVTDTTNALHLVTTTGYSAWSSVNSVSYGNGDSETLTLDPKTGRLNVFTTSIATPGSFSTTGTLTWNPNGSVSQFKWADTNAPSLNTTCNYNSDDLNRIASANCGTPFGETYTYTAFGNISKAVLTSGTPYAPTYNVATNQVSGNAKATYDGNGNQTMTTSVPTMVWNASHNPVSAGSTNMTYDALGRLVEFSGTHYSQVLYGPSGEKLGIYTNGVATEAVPLPGGGEAHYTGLNTLAAIRHKDWLGSSRLATTWAHVVSSKTAYAPYGETYNTESTPDADFTSQTADSVSSFFDFPARKLDSGAGRWVAPDPGAWSVVDFTNPQSFNRYAYVINSPLNLTDPYGLDYIVCPTGPGFMGGQGSGTAPAPPGCISIGDNEYLSAVANTVGCNTGGAYLYCNGYVSATVQYVVTGSTGPANTTCGPWGCGGVAGAMGGGGGGGAGSASGGNGGAPNNQTPKKQSYIRSLFTKQGLCKATQQTADLNHHAGVLTAAGTAVVAGGVFVGTGGAGSEFAGGIALTGGAFAGIYTIDSYIDVWAGNLAGCDIHNPN